MIKVYCERGALRKELNRLSNEGKMELIHFPYEGNTKKLSVAEKPSRLTIDISHITIDSSMKISDCGETDMFDEIKQIIGNHEFDARHIDSAYKNGCSIFLSRDKGDVISHAKELKNLLGIEFFHPDDNWQDFLRVLEENA